jgi:hypothetical protein
MMRTSRETAECLLVHAHALRLHAHRSLAIGTRERADLDACIGRFEASLLLEAPPSLTVECGARLDEQICALAGWAWTP